jgi:Uncharacterised nucleotidyltransferase
MLLACLQAFVKSEAPQHPPGLLWHSIDWQLLLRIASWHGVTPVVHTVLKKHCSDALPPQILRQFQAGFQANAVQNLSRMGELRRLLEILHGGGIPGVPFKGPALASLAYGSLSLREFCDLDILVRAQDVTRITALLREHGYQTDLPAEPYRQAAYLRTRHEIHFVPNDGGTLIELHQTFLPRFACFEPDYSSLWRRIEKISLCGTQAWSLPLEDMLLVLCAHGAKHCWARLGWICDIAALLSRHGERLDWSQITRQAHSLGAGRLLSLGLLLAARIAGVYAPAEIMRQAEEDAVAQKLASQTEEILASRITPGELQSHWFFLQTRERLSTRIRYVSRLCFTPTEEDRIPDWLPSHVAPLQSLWHAGRVFAKCGSLLK